MIEFSDNTAHRHLTWNEAWMYCLTLDHNGHKDWRMPNYEEFKSIRIKWPSTWFDCTGWPEGGAPQFGTYIIIPIRTID